jgi:hypothetical protein
LSHGPWRSEPPSLVDYVCSHGKGLQSTIRILHGQGERGAGFAPKVDQAKNTVAACRTSRNGKRENANTPGASVLLSAAVVVSLVDGRSISPIKPTTHRVRVDWLDSLICFRKSGRLQARTTAVPGADDDNDDAGGGRISTQNVVCVFLG